MAAGPAIAKARFASSYLRADPILPAIAKDELASFHDSLDAALDQCSPANVQKCKKWIIRNVAPSKPRTIALGEYLKFLSKSFAPSFASPFAPPFAPPQNGPPQNGSPTRLSGSSKASAKRKQLHILYIVSDVVHHVKRHDQTTYNDFTREFTPFLVDIVGLASILAVERNKKLYRKILDLLDLWEANEVFGKERVNSFHRAVKSSIYLYQFSVGSEPALFKEFGAETESSAPANKSPPFNMPSHHGDPSAPWYDLPAGNMVHHLKHHPTNPIPIRDMKPVQFRQGPADTHLVNLVQDFLKDAQRIYPSTGLDDEGIVADIDEMGHPMVQDEGSGTVAPLDSYYGWSLSFCGTMKKMRTQDPRQHDRAERVRNLSQSDSDSRSRNFSRGSSPREHRRYSSGNSRHGERRRPGRQSRSRSRSGSPRRRYSSRDSRTRSRSPYSRHSSRERSSSRTYHGLRSPDRRRSRSRSRSARRSYARPPNSNTGHTMKQPTPAQNRFNPMYPRPQQTEGGNLPPNPLPPPFEAPPPPPPDYNGPWPPPLPNMPFQPYPSVVPPPPPPPPPNYNGQWPPAPPNVQADAPFQPFSQGQNPAAYGGQHVNTGPWNQPANWVPPPNQGHQGGYGGTNYNRGAFANRNGQNSRGWGRPRRGGGGW